ncbi:unnamed protein product [Amoebophrya sp. A25]|nr:unnamed protein product [Amoebophrya sp. A25]|eukprot:GSA25T00002461001.1
MFDSSYKNAQQSQLFFELRRAQDDASAAKARTTAKNKVSPGSGKMQLQAFVILRPLDDVTAFDGDVVVTSTNAWLQGIKNGGLYSVLDFPTGGADAKLHSLHPDLAVNSRKALVAKRDRTKRRLRREADAVKRGEVDKGAYQQMLTPRGGGYYARAESNFSPTHLGSGGTQSQQANHANHDLYTPRSAISQRSDNNYIYASPAVLTPVSSVQADNSTDNDDEMFNDKTNSRSIKQQRLASPRDSDNKSGRGGTGGKNLGPRANSLDPAARGMHSPRGERSASKEVSRRSTLDPAALGHGGGKDVTRRTTLDPQALMGGASPAVSRSASKQSNVSNRSNSKTSNVVEQQVSFLEKTTYAPKPTNHVSSRTPSRGNPNFGHRTHHNQVEGNHKTALAFASTSSTCSSEDDDRLDMMSEMPSDCTAPGRFDEHMEIMPLLMLDNDSRRTVVRPRSSGSTNSNSCGSSTKILSTSTVGGKGSTFTCKTGREVVEESYLSRLTLGLMPSTSTFITLYEGRHAEPGSGGGVDTSRGFVSPRLSPNADRSPVNSRQVSKQSGRSSNLDHLLDDGLPWDNPNHPNNRKNEQDELRPKGPTVYHVKHRRMVKPGLGGRPDDSGEAPDHDMMDHLQAVIDSGNDIAVLGDVADRTANAAPGSKNYRPAYLLTPRDQNPLARTTGGSNTNGPILSVTSTSTAATTSASSNIGGGNNYGSLGSVYENNTHQGGPSPRTQTKHRAVQKSNVRRKAEDGRTDVVRLELGEIVETEIIVEADSSATAVHRNAQFSSGLAKAQRVLHTCLPVYPADGGNSDNTAARPSQSLSPEQDPTSPEFRIDLSIDKHTVHDRSPEAKKLRASKRQALEEQVGSAEVANTLLREVYHDTLYWSLFGDPLAESKSKQQLLQLHSKPDLHMCYPALGCGARRYPPAVSARMAVQGWLESLEQDLSLYQQLHQLQDAELPRVVTIEVRFSKNTAVYKEWSRVCFEMLCQCSDKVHRAAVASAMDQHAGERGGAHPGMPQRPVAQAPKAERQKKLCCFG